MNEYIKQAKDFLEKTGVKFKAVHKEYGHHFLDDKKKDYKRNIFRITLSRGRIRYSFDFGDSVSNSQKFPVQYPTEYDVLTCLTKYDVGSFEDFCHEFGYDEDSRTAERIYKAVLKEYDGVCKLWSEEEIEELQEIQ